MSACFIRTWRCDLPEMFLAEAWIGSAAYPVRANGLASDLIIDDHRDGLS